MNDREDSDSPLRVNKEHAVRKATCECPTHAPAHSWEGCWTRRDLGKHTIERVDEFDTEPSTLIFIPGCRVADLGVRSGRNRQPVANPSRHVARRSILSCRRTPRAEDFGPNLGPRPGRRRVSLVLGKAPIEFRGQLGRERQGFIGGVLDNRVPEVLDELETFCHGQLPELCEINCALGHGCNVKERSFQSKRCVVHANVSRSAASESNKSAWRSHAQSEDRLSAATFVKWRPRDRGTASACTRQRRQLGNLLGILRLESVPQIPVRLEPEPEIGTQTGDLRETQRRIGGNSALATNDFDQPGKRDAQADRERRLRDAKRLEKLVEEHFTGRGRRKRGGEPSPDERAISLGAPSGSP